MHHKKNNTRDTAGCRNEIEGASVSGRKQGNDHCVGLLLVSPGVGVPAADAGLGLRWNMCEKAIDLEAWKDLYKSLGKEWCDPLSAIKHEQLSSERQDLCEDDKEVSSRCVEVGSSLGSTSTEVEIEETGSDRDVEGSKESPASSESRRKTMECEAAPAATMDCDDKQGHRRAKKRPGVEQKLPAATRIRMTRVSRPGCSQFVPRWTNCSRPTVVSEAPTVASPVKRPRPLAPQLF